MTARLILLLFMSITSVIASAPATAQTAKPTAGAEVGLRTRLKEVEANAHQLELALKGGAKVASFCANCHGDGGNSIKPDVPNLAGQNASYLLDQLRSYIEGHRPTTDFKRRLIKVLSADEKINLVAFYSRQEVIPKSVQDPDLVNRGKGLYKKLCLDCHEENGHGSEDFSRVAGQQTVYLLAALKTYRDNPSVRFSKDMLLTLRGMTDLDIGALVAYVSSMK